MHTARGSHSTTQLARGAARHVMARAIVLATAGLTLATGAAAQGTAPSGPIAGIVISAQSGQPIPSAQVAVAGTTLGVLTGVDGRFRLSGGR